MLYLHESGPAYAPAVVLLHGGGLSSLQWLPQFERLPELHLLAPDLPGQGQSMAIPFDLDDTALRVAELIREKIPGGKAHVVGLSLGGAITLTILRLAPDVVQSAIVTGTAAILARWLGKLTLSSLWMLRLFSAQTLVNMTVKQQGIPAEYRALVEVDLLKTGADIPFNRATILALMNMQLPQTVACPLLVCVGEKETPAAQDAARKLMRAYPQAVCVSVTGLKHVWNLQDPGLFSEMVRAWVNSRKLPDKLVPLS